MNISFIELEEIKMFSSHFLRNVESQFVEHFGMLNAKVQILQNRKSVLKWVKKRLRGFISDECIYEDNYVDIQNRDRASAEIFDHLRQELLG